jgi:Domain of unknown function (DUF6457)
VAWLDDFAMALGIEPLTPEERRLLLDLARRVAHGTERVNAPLAPSPVGGSLAGRADGAEGIREAARRAQATLPPGTEERGGR